MKKYLVGIISTYINLSNYAQNHEEHTKRKTTTSKRQINEQ